MTTIELTTRDVGRGDLQQWLHAHDLDPRDTAVGLTVVDGVIHAQLYVRDADGRLLVDRDELNGQILGPRTESVTIPLRQPLPAGLGTVTA